MIVSGQMTREHAVDELKKPIGDKTRMREYICIIKEKLHISDDEFNVIMAAPAKQHTDYKTDKLAERIHILIAIRRKRKVQIPIFANDE